MYVVGKVALIRIKTYRSFMEDRKDIPKSSPFAYWLGAD